MTEAHPKETIERRRFLTTLVFLAITGISLVGVVVAVQTSRARFHADISNPWGTNYAILVEAKKQAMENCADVISIGDSSGLPIDAGVIAEQTGRHFVNMNLYGTTEFSGYLSQIAWLKKSGCRPDLIIVYLAPETILTGAGLKVSGFENVFTILHFGSIGASARAFADKAKVFNKIFHNSIKTLLNFSLVQIRGAGLISSEPQNITNKLFRVLRGDSPEAESIDSLIGALASARGAVAFTKPALDAAKCSIMYSIEGDVREMRSFRRALEHYFPARTFVVMSAGLPACVTNLDATLDKVRQEYDVAPSPTDPALFIDGIHPNVEGGRILGEPVAQVIRART